MRFCISPAEYVEWVHGNVNLPICRGFIPALSVSNDRTPYIIVWQRGSTHLWLVFSIEWIIPFAVDMPVVRSRPAQVPANTRVAFEILGGGTLSDVNNKGAGAANALSRG